MIPTSTIANFFKIVQTNATPALWSQGVTLTRGGSTFVVSSLSEEECVIHVRTAGTPLSPKVILWPKDQDWDCDCGDDLPCSHIAAATILLKRGELAVTQDSTQSEAALIHYHFKRSPQGLQLERKLVGGGEELSLNTPLLSYTAGINSGRIQGPEVLASKTDYAIDQILRTYRGTQLERPRLEALFKTFESEQKVFLDNQPVQISDSRLAASYECVDEADGYRLRRVINPLVFEVFPSGVALCLGNILRLLNPKLLNSEESKFVDGEGSFWPANKENVLFSQILPQLQKKITITVSSLKRPQSLEIPPRIHLSLEKEPAENNTYVLSVLANLVYGDPPISQLNPATFELSPINEYRSAKTSAATNAVIMRDQNAERSLLQKLGRDLNLQIGRRVIMRGIEAINFVRKTKDWSPDGDGFAAFTPELRSLGAGLKIDEYFENGVGQQYALDVKFNVLGAEESSSSVSFEQVFKAWQQGAEYIPLLDGAWAQIPKDWLVRYGKRIKDFLIAREASQPIPKHRLHELASLCEEMKVPYPDSLEKLKCLLEDFRAIEDANLPQDLNAELRSYQKKGVNWLCFLRDAGLGAMLADDMGLGKTLQMLCALKGKSLIIAPTSVIYNWAAEIKKFRPSLKVDVYYGPQRQMSPKPEVVLTTYGVLRLDQEKLRSYEWDTIVLDEAQTIKNPESQVAKAAHSLRADFKATLSGTPVENRLDDLWSQFEFINPGFLGTRNEFLEKYARPIVQGESHIAAELKARIKPFILRRLKREVAPELPPRTEVVLNCELSKDERATYESLLASTRKEVLASLEGGGSVIKALEVILRLRQACCHTALIPGHQASTSSKVELLMETLEESLSEGHKSLVFSQWTSFLDLIAEDLKKSGVRFSRIDGSTQNRQSLVEQFQSEDGPPIMLISLKAGGVGLTLTAADHVFITDPWWNPSVEDQAADRAHRIGQQNPVLIHRLVAKDTIEERILALQETKKDLAKSVLEEGSGALSLTRQDLMNLLL
jgi:superfamily II DNA or RNA helicase